MWFPCEQNAIFGPVFASLWLFFPPSLACFFFSYLKPHKKLASSLPARVEEWERCGWFLTAVRTGWCSCHPQVMVGGYFQAFKAGYPRVIQVHLHVNTYLIKTEDQNGEERRFKWLWTRHGRLSVSWWSAGTFLTTISQVYREWFEKQEVTNERVTLFRYTFKILKFSFNYLCWSWDESLLLKKRALLDHPETRVSLVLMFNSAVLFPAPNSPITKSYLHHLNGNAPSHFPGIIILHMFLPCCPGGETSLR